MVSEKIFLIAVLLAAVLVFGCVQQPPRPTPSPTAVPTVTATPVPSEDLPPMPPDDQGNLQGATSTPEPTSDAGDELPPLPE